MASSYNRRRPAILRNLWVYRYLVVAAMILGVILWFIWINNTEATVAFPFNLGSIRSRLGIVILLSALAGALAAAMAMTLFLAVHKVRGDKAARSIDREYSKPLAGPDDELPPANYAAKTTEGFPETRWPK